MKRCSDKSAYIFIMLFFLLSFPIISFSQQYWNPQQSPASKSLHRSSFPDSVHGWVSGDSGIIIHTSNGGNSWSIQQTGINSNIYDIFFMNSLKGWAVANDVSYNSTLVLKTTNGGENWTSYFFPDTNNIIMAIYFLDTLKGFMGGFNGIVYTTTNGGESWFVNSTLTGNCSSSAIRRFIFHNPNYGYASGGIIDLAGAVWKTTDGGLNWIAQCVAPEPIYDIKFADSLFVLAMGGDVEYGMSRLYTVNAGVNWLYEELGFFGFVESFSFRTQDELWASGGFSLRLAVSTNRGLNWLDVPAPDSNAINEINFLSPTLGWAFGNRGAIYKYNTAVIGIKEIESEVPADFKLYQNYPNPFNAKTKIKFEIRPPLNPLLSKEGKTRFIGTGVVLKIYDILGCEITTLINQELSPGTYEAEWDGTNYASGLYYYKITAGEYSETKKMVLIK
jgi:photosystem II stability/assembly factor-like uncharacterized protein